MGTTSFLNLPSEVRDMIYAHTFDGDCAFAWLRSAKFAQKPTHLELSDSPWQSQDLSKYELVIVPTDNIRTQRVEFLMRGDNYLALPSTCRITWREFWRYCSYNIPFYLGAIVFRHQLHDIKHLPALYRPLQVTFPANARYNDLFLEVLPSLTHCVRLFRLLAGYAQSGSRPSWYSLSGKNSFWSHDIRSWIKEAAKPRRMEKMLDLASRCRVTVIYDDYQTCRSKLYMTLGTRLMQSRLVVSPSGTTCLKVRTAYTSDICQPYAKFQEWHEIQKLSKNDPWNFDALPQGWEPERHYLEAMRAEIGNAMAAYDTYRADELIKIWNALQPEPYSG